MISERPSRLIGDPISLALGLGLAVFGVTMIYSAGKLDIPSLVTGIWRKQAIWLVLSLIAFALVLRIPVKWLEWVSPTAYVVAMLGLVLVLVIDSGSGPRSWIRFGPIGFQPSEFAKLATILMLGRLSGGRERPPDTLWDLWPLVAVVALPVLLIMAEPDLGTAAVFVGILIGAIFWSGLPLSKLILFLSPLVSLGLAFSTPIWGLWFLTVVAFLYWTRSYLSESLAVILGNIGMGVVVLPAWRSLATYQQNRILAFLQPEADPQGAGWHLIQSQVAIGSGGWFGKGFTLGSQKRLAFLPEQHTDFIVSVVGEELGFVGIALILAAFGLLLWRLLRIAERTADSFASTVVFGIFACWFVHLLANVGMTVGLLPITGLPLTFLSYGGSFLLVSFVCLSIAQRIAAENRVGV